MCRCIKGTYNIIISIIYAQWLFLVCTGYCSFVVMILNLAMRFLYSHATSQAIVMYTMLFTLSDTPALPGMVVSVTVRSQPSEVAPPPLTVRHTPVVGFPSSTELPVSSNVTSPPAEYTCNHK